MTTCQPSSDNVQCIMSSVSIHGASKTTLCLMIKLKSMLGIQTPELRGKGANLQSTDA